MKLTKKKAIELSIKKWEWIVENDGITEGLFLAIPELQKLSGNCGLCEYDDIHGDSFCSECPLMVDGDPCGSPVHPWSIWDERGVKENAQKVLDLIKSIK